MTEIHAYQQAVPLAMQLAAVAMQCITQLMTMHGTIMTLNKQQCNTQATPLLVQRSKMCSAGG